MNKLYEGVNTKDLRETIKTKIKLIPSLRHVTNTVLLIAWSILINHDRQHCIWRINNLYKFLCQKSKRMRLWERKKCSGVCLSGT